jgi:hypothetical protein
MLKFAPIAVGLILFCTASRSVSYEVINDVIDDGGTKMTSTDYVLRGSFGQPTIGKIAGVTYAAYIGFWHPYPAGPGIEERFPKRGFPFVFSLSQNYPNPVTTSTTFRYSLARKTSVDLAVYNTAGQRLGDLVRGTQEAGYYSVKWSLSEVSGARLPNGVYFYRIVARDFIETRKMVIMR